MFRRLSVHNNVSKSFRFQSEFYSAQVERWLDLKKVVRGKNQMLINPGFCFEACKYSEMDVDASVLHSFQLGNHKDPFHFVPNLVKFHS